MYPLEHIPSEWRVIRYGLEVSFLPGPVRRAMWTLRGPSQRIARLSRSVSGWVWEIDSASRIERRYLGPLAPWLGGVDEIRRAADQRLAEEALVRRAALAAYLDVCVGLATIEITGTSDSWEVDDGETWGGAPPSAGTYGGSGWTLTVIRNGEPAYVVRADRRAELERWEISKRLITYYVPKECHPAYHLGETWATNLPPGWKVRRDDLIPPTKQETA